MECPGERTVNLFSYNTHNLGKFRIFLGSYPFSGWSVDFQPLFSGITTPIYTSLFSTVVFKTQVSVLNSLFFIGIKETQEKGG